MDKTIILNPKAPDYEQNPDPFLQLVERVEHDLLNADYGTRRNGTRNHAGEPGVWLDVSALGAVSTDAYRIWLGRR